jgi:hypothetical protein
LGLPKTNKRVGVTENLWKMELLQQLLDLIQQLLGSLLGGL